MPYTRLDALAQADNPWPHKDEHFRRVALSRSWRIGLRSSVLFALAAVMASVSPFVLSLLPLSICLCLWTAWLQPLRLPSIVFRAFGTPGAESFLRHAVFEIGSPVRWIWLGDPKSRGSSGLSAPPFPQAVAFFSWIFAFVLIGIAVFMLPFGVRLAVIISCVLLGSKSLILLVSLRPWRPSRRMPKVRSERDILELVAEIGGARRLMPRYLRAIPVALNEVYCGDAWFETVVAVTSHVPFALMDLTYLLTTDDGGPQSDGSPGIRINLWLEDRLLYQSSIHVFYTCREDRIEVLRKEMPEREIFPWSYQEATQAVMFDTRELRRHFYRFLKHWEVAPFPKDSRATMDALRSYTKEYLRSQGLSDDI